MRRRDPVLDSLRGIFLVVMILNHWPGPVLRYTVEPLGLVSAAEGFVFLSGLTAGLVFSRTLVGRGGRALRDRALSRALRIYATHVLTLVTVLTAGLAAAALGGLPPSWAEALPFATVSPLHGLVLGGLLIHQPLYFNILPLYILLLLMLPLVLPAFHAGRQRRVFAVSGGLWLLAQLGPGAALGDRIAGRFGVDSGLLFDPFAWQLLFVAGLWVGFRRSQGSSVLPRGNLSLAAALAAAAVLAWYRYLLKQEIYPFESLLGVDVSNWISKERLGPVRMLDFVVLAYLCGRLVARFPRLLAWRWTGCLGRHSLEVFAAHILLIYAAGAANDTVAADWTPGLRFVASLGGVLLLLLGAWLFERTGVRRSPAAVPVPVAVSGADERPPRCA